MSEFMGVWMLDFIRRLRSWLTYPRNLPHPASPEFLQTREWKEIRSRAFLQYGTRCVVCGRSAKEGAVLDMDRIKPRARFPHVALEIRTPSPLVPIVILAKEIGMLLTGGNF